MLLEFQHSGGNLLGEGDGRRDDDCGCSFVQRIARIEHALHFFTMQSLSEFGTGHLGACKVFLDSLRTCLQPDHDGTPLQCFAHGEGFDGTSAQRDDVAGTKRREGDLLFPPAEILSPMPRNVCVVIAVAFFEYPVGVHPLPLELGRQPLAEDGLPRAVRADDRDAAGADSLAERGMLHQVRMNVLAIEK